MSKRAEEFAVRIHNTALRKAEKYASEHDMGVLGEVSYGWGFKAGAITGYEQAEKDLGLHSVDESLPPVDEEVIVLRDELNGYLLPDAGFVGVGHIVNPELTVEVGNISYTPMSYSGWNIDGVRYWMPMPKLPNEDE